MNASDKGAVVADPYSYDAASIEEPPQSLRGMLRRIGPGLLLTAAIVGTGELIATGETGLQALNHFPGPRALNVNWVVWTWGVIILISLALIGAMYAGLAQVMAQFIPGVSIDAWVVILTGVTLAVLRPSCCGWSPSSCWSPWWPLC